MFEDNPQGRREIYFYLHLDRVNCSRIKNEFCESIRGISSFGFSMLIIIFFILPFSFPFILPYSYLLHTPFRCTLIMKRMSPLNLRMKGVSLPQIMISLLDVEHLLISTRVTSDSESYAMRRKKYSIAHRLGRNGSARRKS